MTGAESTCATSGAVFQEVVIALPHLDSRVPNIAKR